MPIREACHVAVQRNHPSKHKLWKHAQARQESEGKGPTPVLQIVCKILFVYSHLTSKAQWLYNNKKSSSYRTISGHSYLMHCFKLYVSSKPPISILWIEETNLLFILNSIFTKFLYVLGVNLLINTLRYWWFNTSVDSALDCVLVDVLWFTVGEPWTNIWHGLVRVHGWWQTYLIW